MNSSNSSTLRRKKRRKKKDIQSAGHAAAVRPGRLRSVWWQRDFLPAVSATHTKLGSSIVPVDSLPRRYHVSAEQIGKEARKKINSFLPLGTRLYGELFRKNEDRSAYRY